MIGCSITLRNQGRIKIILDNFKRKPIKLEKNNITALGRRLYDNIILQIEEEKNFNGTYP